MATIIKKLGTAFKGFILLNDQKIASGFGELNQSIRALQEKNDEQIRPYSMPSIS